MELNYKDPELFSAKWFSGKHLDESVQSKDKMILIIISSGQISHPTEPKMSNKQRNIVKQLINPIVERDSKYLIDKLLNYA